MDVVGDAAGRYWCGQNCEASYLCSLRSSLWRVTKTKCFLILHANVGDNMILRIGSGTRLPMSDNSGWTVGRLFRLISLNKTIVRIHFSDCQRAGTIGTHFRSIDGQMVIFDGSNGRKLLEERHFRVCTRSGIGTVFLKPPLDAWTVVRSPNFDVWPHARPHALTACGNNCTTVIGQKVEVGKARYKASL